MTSVGGVLVRPTTPFARCNHDGLRGASSRADVERFRCLLLRHDRDIHAFILSLHPDWEEAEDILQNTYLRLCHELEQALQCTDFRAWARTVARFEVLTFRRRAQRSGLRFTDRFVEVALECEHAHREEIDFRTDALSECLQTLKPERRRLVDLVYGGGYSVEQVAEQLDLTVAAAYKALARARKTLHECVERKLRSWGVEGRSLRSLHEICSTTFTNWRMRF